MIDGLNPEIQGLRQEMHAWRDEMREDLREFRQEVKSQVESLRSWRHEFANITQKAIGEVAIKQTEIDGKVGGHDARLNHHSVRMDKQEETMLMLQKASDHRIAAIEETVGRWRGAMKVVIAVGSGLWAVFMAGLAILWDWTHKGGPK